MAERVRVVCPDCKSLLGFVDSEAEAAAIVSDRDLYHGAKVCSNVKEKLV